VTAITEIALNALPFGARLRDNTPWGSNFSRLYGLDAEVADPADMAVYSHRRD
jgi:hypothetical protein